MRVLNLVEPHLPRTSPKTSPFTGTKSPNTQRRGWNDVVHLHADTVRGFGACRNPRQTGPSRRRVPQFYEELEKKDRFNGVKSKQFEKVRNPTVPRQNSPGDGSETCGAGLRRRLCFHSSSRLPLENEEKLANWLLDERARGQRRKMKQKANFLLRQMTETQPTNSLKQYNGRKPCLRSAPVAARHESGTRQTKSTS